MHGSIRPSRLFYMSTLRRGLAITMAMLALLPVQLSDSGVALNAAYAKKPSVKSSAPKDQTQSSKWAAIVVDASQGKILYEKNAEARRHPASLTKMMTLYLLFDALDRRKVSLQTNLRASKRAASQPQTNISLTPGDTLTVNRAIEALVIRSANDVSVVVAEHLGGSVEGFATKMNQKARELGMKNTKFYNPHGLPDDRQVTTAMDIAKLSIALRRDFPQYYHFFKKSSFTHNGRTYKSHNRVMGRAPGVDGIKTGYIRASGFNLATSIVRGDLNLVGVILGGVSGSARDQEMISMLERTIVAMKRDTGSQRYASLEPQAASPAKPASTGSSTGSSTGISSEEARDEGTSESIEAARRKQVQQLTLPASYQETLGQTAPYLTGKNWAVQVGAFPTLEQAESAAAAARRIAPESLGGATIHISQVMKDNQVFNRSRMLYLSADQARQACDSMNSARKQCMVIRMEN